VPRAEWPLPLTSLRGMYRAPTTDMRWVITEVAGLDEISRIDAFRHVDADTVAGLLDEAARFTSEVVAPLGRTGDTVGSMLGADGAVTTPPGYVDAYRRFVEAGWPAAPFPQEWGGGGMPRAVAIAFQEMLTSADMALSLCPMLTSSAVELLLSHGSDEQRGTYLERLVSGEWTGTMALTEPHAGSDVGALSTRAEPAGDGTWRVRGTKTFITWGEHDLTDNIVHMVLARTPGSPEGTRGISCFIVPKRLVEPDGSLGRRNDVTCVSLEHKLGIHASPTCVLSFGEAGEGAVGYLVGEEHGGMRVMFSMMNPARLYVGLEGLAVAERAYQQSAAYALERRQGRAPGDDDGGPSPIVRHPDVRRMLMLMRSSVEAMRCLMYRNAAAIDLGDHHPDETVREREADLAGLLTPLSKAWGTDLGVELASQAIQVHGGAGYVEETGVAQLWRDARIAPIYEGTNGIQAVDLVKRKLPMGGGAVVRSLLTHARGDAEAMTGSLAVTAAHLAEAVDTVARATDHLLDADHTDALAGATTYCRMLATTVGGWLLAQSARTAAEGRDGYPESFLAAKVASARFFGEQVLSTVPGMLAGVVAGADATFGIPEEHLGGGA
jgi:3-(methylthio)propanoyl-CoA dehydrogenase